MKKILFVALLGAMTACHSSKYAAHFQSYKSNVGYEPQVKSESVITPIQPERLVASASNAPAMVSERVPQVSAELAAQVRKTYFQMTKEQRKTFRKAVKSAIRNQAALHSNRSVQAAPPDKQWWQGWDQDLKLAAIFGAIGTVAMIIYVEPFFIIGAVALIIGLVFLIKWFVRQ